MKSCKGEWKLHRQFYAYNHGFMQHGLRDYKVFLDTFYGCISENNYSGISLTNINVVDTPFKDAIASLLCISWYCAVVGVICNIVTLWCCSSCLSVLLSAAFLCTQDRRNKHMHGDVIYCTFWLSCSEWVLNYLTTTVLPDKDIGESLYDPLKVMSVENSVK